MRTAALKRRRRVIRDEGPDPIDVFVGQRLRERRHLAGLSQSELGKHFGVSFQAVQKYEVAEIRLAASTLYRLGQIFSVPLGYFFEGYGATGVRLKRKARR